MFDRSRCPKCRRWTRIKRVGRPWVAWRVYCPAGCWSSESVFCFDGMGKIALVAEAGISIDRWNHATQHLVCRCGGRPPGDDL